MRKSITSILSRVMIGGTAFLCAGSLIASIFIENGGSPNSQAEWSDAQTRSVAISSSQRQVAARPSDDEPALDEILTGSIKPITDVEQAEIVETERSAPRELSVLSIIRENSDVAPGVTSGTDRVSVTVKKGDTLFGIAKKHGLTMSELARMNGLEEPYVIKVDQTLYVAR
ncbi:MAG: LysM domain-containing protein [Rhizobiaceae bacterium]|nr:LysM domain-containing protein [Rhizobiaceae bacterium]